MDLSNGGSSLMIGMASDTSMSLEQRSPSQPQLDTMNTSPTPAGDTPVPLTPSGRGQKRKRKQSSGNTQNGAREGSESPGVESQDELGGLPKARRACNECRQQKTEPFTRCARCDKLGLECRIDANFKRVGKRSKHAEMERELVELRQQVAQYQGLVDSGKLPATLISPPRRVDPSAALHQGAADSLLDLSRGVKTARARAKAPTKPQKLGEVTLTGPRIDDLFAEYLTHYHCFLPVIDAQASPNQTYDLCPMLFWVILTVASRRDVKDPTLLGQLDEPLSKLISDTMFSNPQNYHVVKGLAIICSWPLPRERTSDDLTFLLGGLMMEIALQTGLHRPSRVQDFYTRQRIELREEDHRDRLRTWICCNIVAQEISTAFGHPPRTIYDSSLTSLAPPTDAASRSVSAELYWRLQIERFCNRVSQNFYNNKANPIGIASPEERSVWMGLLMDEYNRLRVDIERHGSQVCTLYLHAAGLHLHLSAFFDSSSAPNYVKDLLNLYFATTAFLRTLFEMQLGEEPALPFATHHLMMIMLGACTSLMKLLNSFFAQHVDTESGRKLFNDTIENLRVLSVRKDDLPARLAEAMAQLWRYYREGDGRIESNSSNSNDNLKLKIQARGSMSVLFDSVWQWREQFSFPFGGSTSRLDYASSNPTIAEIPKAELQETPGFSSNDLQHAGNFDYLVDPTFDLFDPVSTMLDTQLLPLQFNETANNMSFTGASGNAFYN